VICKAARSAEVAVHISVDEQRGKLTLVQEQVLSAQGLQWSHPNSALLTPVERTTDELDLEFREKSREVLVLRRFVFADPVRWRKSEEIIHSSCYF